MTQSALTLRPAGPDDHQTLFELKRRASLAVPEDREALLAHPEAIVLEIAHLKPDTTVIASLDGETAGYVCVMPGPNRTSHVFDLFVDPPFWRRGVGSRLIAAAEDLARGQDATRMAVVAGAFALPFYIACGFSPYAPQPTQFSPATALIKPIAD